MHQLVTLNSLAIAGPKVAVGTFVRSVRRRRVIDHMQSEFHALEWTMRTHDVVGKPQSGFVLVVRVRSFAGLRNEKRESHQAQL